MTRAPSELHRAVAAREAALRRVGRLTTLFVAVSAAGTAVAAGVAAATTHLRHLPAATRAAASVGRATQRTAGKPLLAPAPQLVPVEGGSVPAAPAAGGSPATPVQPPTPAPTTPPAVVSGGS